MKRGSLEQWKELAELTREVGESLAIICEKADEIMYRGDWVNVSRAYHAISKFKGHAQAVMFHQLGEEGGARRNIFYGPRDMETAEGEKR